MITGPNVGHETTKIADSVVSDATRYSGSGPHQAVAPQDEVADTQYPLSNIRKSVKVVIWDLDETFWKGTLSEGGIEPIQANIDLVRSLNDRGIMSSICSKNDYQTARAKLVELGIWDSFVFAHIDWTPKGQAIQNMIKAMQLRDENIVFLDDNHMNLEEALFFNPNIMAVDGTRDFNPLLQMKELKGKDDSTHTRLAQYKVMETKQDEQSDGDLSNEEFLRQSEIKIKIITDIDNNMDRVLELLNRTNQLNFTKVRANTEKELAELHEVLQTSGMHAGLIHAQDRYGDYGIVGFFCVRTKFSGTTVHHFTFSCRTLNMGVEQWVWEYLNRPDFEVAKPVANPVDSFDKVDWIQEVSSFDDTGDVEEKRICLVGGCDLLQVSFYCGNKRDEFVNKQDDDGFLVRYDDLGFFLNPRTHAVKNNGIMKRLPSCSWEDMLALDESLAKSDNILLSMYFSYPSDNLFSFGGKEFGGEYLYNAPIRTLKKIMNDSDFALWFAKSMHLRRLERDERLELTRQCFVHAYDLKQPGTPLFILGAGEKYGQQAERTRHLREPYNDMCRAFCDAHDGAVFIDVDALLDEDEFANSDHYTRTGYFKIADFVNTYGEVQKQAA